MPPASIFSSWFALPSTVDARISYRVFGKMESENKPSPCSSIVVVLSNFREPFF